MTIDLYDGLDEMLRKLSMVSVEAHQAALDRIAHLEAHNAELEEYIAGLECRMAADHTGGGNDS